MHPKIVHKQIDMLSAMNRAKQLLLDNKITGKSKQMITLSIKRDQILTSFG